MKTFKIINPLLIVACTAGLINAAKAETTRTYIYETKTKKASSPIVITEEEVATFRTSDKAIREMLDDKIDSYPELDDDVIFKVHEGIVVLRGTVDSYDEKDEAAMVARNIPGVIDVDNLLKVEK